MKERSERALRQAKYLKADLYYNLLSCLAAFLFLLFRGLVLLWLLFLPVGDRRGTLEVRLHKAETQSHHCKAYSALPTWDPPHLTARATAWPAIGRENRYRLYL